MQYENPPVLFSSKDTLSDSVERIATAKRRDEDWADHLLLISATEPHINGSQGANVFHSLNPDFFHRQYMK